MTNRLSAAASGDEVLVAVRLGYAVDLDLLLTSVEPQMTSSYDQGRVPLLVDAVYADGRTRWRQPLRDGDPLVVAAGQP